MIELLQHGVLEDLRHERSKVADRSSPTQDVWGYQVSGIDSYDDTFRNVLPHGHITIRETVWEMQDAGRGIFALDTMSYGGALRTFPKLTGGLSVGLRELVANDSHRDQERNLHTQTGDLLDDKTWNKIHEWIEDQRPDDPYFDLITHRPLGGQTRIRSKTAFLLGMRRLYGLLNPNGGAAFIELPYKNVKLAPTGDNVRSLLMHGDIKGPSEVRIGLIDENTGQKALFIRR